MEDTVRAITTASGRELRADIEWDYSTEQRGYLVRVADVTAVPGWEAWLTHAEAMQIAEQLAELACTAALRNGQDAEVQHQCHRCGRPAVRDAAGAWTHGEAADAAFCALVMHGQDRPGE